MHLRPVVGLQDLDAAHLSGAGLGQGRLPMSPIPLRQSPPGLSVSTQRSPSRASGPHCPRQVFRW